MINGKTSIENVSNSGIDELKDGGELTNVSSGTKEMLLGKILAFIRVFEEFSQSDNSDFLLKSLNYLNFTLSEERFDNAMEVDLLSFTSAYIADVEKVYSFCVNTTDIFDEFDLGFLRDSFEQLVNFISQELNFIPEFDESLLINQKADWELIESIRAFEPFTPLKSVKISFDEIINLNEFQDFAIDSLEIVKEDLMGKLCHYIRLFEKLEPTYNSFLVSGSLDYLRIVLREENISPLMKGNLFNLIYVYIGWVNKIYSLLGSNHEILVDFNLYILDDFFDRMQNYIAQVLDILPRGDDDEFDESLCYW